ncbi:hypothetical protein SLA2020_417850 [Shorea laevis]
MSAQTQPLSPPTAPTNPTSIASSLPSPPTPPHHGILQHHRLFAQLVDTVYGLFLCRGDLSADACRDCAADATKDVVDRCPNEQVAVAWYDECMLRYSNQDIFSRMVTDPNLILMNTAEYIGAKPV